MSVKTPKDRSLEISYLMGRFHSEHLVRVYHLFEGDLPAAIVFATVAQHNLQRFYDEIARNSDAGFDELVESSKHLEHLRYCNSLSVSGATGVPRETVRRKVHMLEKKGLLKVGERGELLIAPRISKQFASFDRETSRQFEKYARQVLKLIDERGRRAR